MRRAASALEVAAENLAIRFVNTVAWRLREAGEDRLATPDLLLVWLERQGVATSEQIDALSHTDDVDLSAFHQQAVQLREAIYGILVSTLRGVAPDVAHLELFSALHRDALASHRLAWWSGALRWRPQRGAAPTTAILAPITLSAAELITGLRAAQVRQCQDEAGCGWLFVDESRAGNRRWCSMGDCGNRAKARRHYARTRSNKPSFSRTPGS